jgi:hypothetical protein
MAQFDKDSIRDFVRQWKREVAFEDRQRHRQEQKRRAENKLTWQVMLGITSFAAAFLLILVLIGAIHK